MILTIIVIVIITIIIIIKCIGRYRTPTTTNNGTPCEIAEWSKAFRQYQKELPPRCCQVFIYDFETAYSSLNVMNRGRLYRLNSLLGTLPHLISQE